MAINEVFFLTMIPPVPIRRDSRLVRPCVFIFFFFLERPCPVDPVFVGRPGKRGQTLLTRLRPLRRAAVREPRRL